MRVACVVFAAVWAVFSGTLRPAKSQITPSSVSEMTNNSPTGPPVQTAPASTPSDSPLSPTLEVQSSTITPVPGPPVQTAPASTPLDSPLSPTLKVQSSRPTTPVPDVTSAPPRNPITVRCPRNVFMNSSRNMTEVYWKPPLAEGIVEPATITRTSTHCPGTLFPVGQPTEVKYVFLMKGELTTTCVFFVIVTFDNIPPAVNCPATVNIRKTIPAGSNVVPVSWEPPFVMEGQKNITETSNYRPRDQFSAGIYTVTYSFEDLAGNVAMCNLTVNVTQERIDPITVTNCPKGGVRLISNTVTSYVQLNEDFRPRADGPETNLVVFPGNDGYFSSGVTSVTFTFTDVKNVANNATCEFNVTVIPVCYDTRYTSCNFSDENPDPTCIPAPIAECGFNEREICSRVNANSICRYAKLLNTCVRYSEWFSPEDPSFRGVRSVPEESFSSGQGESFVPEDSSSYSSRNSTPKPSTLQNESTYDFIVPGIFQTPIHLAKIRVAWSRFRELFNSRITNSGQGVTIYANVFVDGTSQTSRAAFWVYPGLTRPNPTDVFLNVPLLVQPGQRVEVKLSYMNNEGSCFDLSPFLQDCPECVSVAYSTHDDAVCGGAVCLYAYSTRNQPTRNQPISNTDFEQPPDFNFPSCKDDQREQTLLNILEPCFPPAEFEFVTPNVSANIGDIVLLTCVGSGIAEPLVTWYNETNEIVAQGNGVAVHRVFVESSPKSFTCVLDHAASRLVVYETATTVSVTTEECTRLLQDLQKFETDYPQCLAFSQVTSTGRYSLDFSGWKTNVLVHQISISSQQLHNKIVKSGLWPSVAQTVEPIFLSLGFDIRQQYRRPSRKRRGVSEGGSQFEYQKVFDSVTVSQDRGVNLTFEFSPPLVANDSFSWVGKLFNPDLQNIRPRFYEGQLRQYYELHYLTCTNSTELTCTDSLVQEWERALLAYTNAGCSRKETNNRRSSLSAYKICKGISSSAPEIKLSPSSIEGVFSEERVRFDCLIENAVEYHWYQTAPVAKERYITSGSQLFLFTSVYNQGAFTCEGVGGRPYQDVRVRTKPALLITRGTATFQLEMRLPNLNYTDDLANPQSLTYFRRSLEIGIDLSRRLSPVPGTLEPRVIAFSPSSSGVIVKSVLFIFLNEENSDSTEFINYSLLRGRLALELRNGTTSLQHPVDIRSINIVNLGACDSEVLSKEDLTFPQTRIELTASSMEVCPQFTTRDGLPRATRTCVGDFSAEAYWEEPVISSCFEGNVELSLANLANILVTPENAEDIARETEILTSNVSTISPQALSDVARILENLVAANATSARTTSSFISIVNNIIQLEDEDTFDQAANNNSPSRILFSLEAYVSAFQLASDPTAPSNFSEVRSSLAVHALKVPRSSLINGIGITSLQNLAGNDQLTEQHVQIVSRPDSRPDVEASIFLPGGIIEQIPEGPSEQVPVSFFLYQSSALFRSPTLRSTVNPDAPFRRAVGSRIIAATVEGVRIQNLAEPIASEFYLLNVSRTNETVTSAQCVFWDFALNDGFGNWSTEGCTNDSITDGVVRCLCDHLTSFAVIVDIYGQEEGHIAVDIISKFGCAVSILALLITVTTYLYSKKLRSKVPQQILISLCFALLGLYVVFLVGIEATSTGAFCVIVAVLIHYFTLAAIAWMATEAFNMYLLFVRVLNANVSRFFLKASAAAWGVPLVVVIITLAADHTVYNNPDYCFLRAGNAIYFAQMLPIGLVLLFNLAIFVLVIYRLTCARKTIGSTSNKSKKEETIRRLQNAVAISVLLGLTWVFAILAVFRASNFAFQILFVVFNSLQGLAVFVLFCLKQAEVRQVWMDVFGCKKKKAHYRQPVSGTGTGTGTGAVTGDVTGDESTLKSSYQLQSKSQTTDATETL